MDLGTFSTIPEMFVRATDEYGKFNRVAVAQTTRLGTVSLTHGELRARVDSFACGLSQLGIVKGDRVGIIAENRPEWVISDYAVLSLGAVDVPVFPSLTAEQVRWIYDNAGATAALVSNDFQLRKILSVANALPELKTIVVMAREWAGQVNESDESDGSDRSATIAGSIATPRLISFEQVLALGAAHQQSSPDFIGDARHNIAPDDLATIIYTSGTTGTPKGVMITHNNLISNLTAALKALPPIDHNDAILSYLPLCHSFERIASYFMFACGVQSTLAESIDKVAENLREAKPTIVTTVPRLLERMYAKIMKRMESGPSRAKSIFQWAVTVGRKYNQMRRIGRIGPIIGAQMAVANYMVFSKLHALIGGRLRFFVSGGAALPKELGEFFEAIGIIVLEGYGMTECSPVISVNRFGSQTFGTVGPVLPGQEVEIAPDGEILTRGQHVMRGYWRNDEATREAIDGAGWLHTGDVGMIDEHGNIKITDRKKHLFVSSGGKNIAPQAIENELLQSLYIDQIFLIGDNRPFVTALIVPEFEALGIYAKEHAIDSVDHAALIANPEVIALYQHEIDRLQSSLAKYEWVRRFTLLATPFTIDAGELTPTMKIKRGVVMGRYGPSIEGMYAA